MDQIENCEIIKTAPEEKIKNYKYKGKENEYFRDYTKNRFYFCNVCKCKITITHKERHLKTAKHIKKNKSKKLDENAIFSLICLV
jgi:hypothetical protein